MEDDGEGSDMAWLKDELQTLSLKSETLYSQGWPALIGTVLTERFYRRDGLNAFVRSVWKTKQKFVIEDVGQNLYLFIFDSEEDFALVMHGGPWVFRKQWLLLSPMAGKMEKKDVAIFESPVWLHLCNIPPGSDREDLVRQVGEVFGGVLAKEITKRWCKVKILFDIRRPLIRGTKARVEGDEHQWISFQYESLSIFYYGCGWLGHGLDDCMHVSKEQKKKPESSQRYTSALRAGSNFMARKPYMEGGEGGRGRQKNYFGVIINPPSRHDGIGHKHMNNSTPQTQVVAVPETQFDGDQMMDNVEVGREEQLGEAVEGVGLGRVDAVGGVQPTDALDSPNPIVCDKYGMEVDDNSGFQGHSTRLQEKQAQDLLHGNMTIIVNPSREVGPENIHFLRREGDEPRSLPFVFDSAACVDSTYGRTVEEVLAGMSVQGLDKDDPFGLNKTLAALTTRTCRENKSPMGLRARRKTIATNTVIVKTNQASLIGQKRKNEQEMMEKMGITKKGKGNHNEGSAVVDNLHPRWMP